MAIDTPARIAILGAGPIGLEAALYARYLGYDVDLYERGKACENVLQWGHVRMFSPFAWNCSTLGLAALKAQDPEYRPPGDEELLSGREWVERYLRPLAGSDLVGDALREQTTVLAVGRAWRRKTDLPASGVRGEELFRLLVCDAEGVERIAHADAVIDATGVYDNANWLGQGGIPAVGETAACAHIEYGVPDVLGLERDRYAGKRVLVAGAGYSAATTVAALGQLAREAKETSVLWITRAPREETPGGPVPVIPDDRLSERRRLAEAANALAAGSNAAVRHLPGTAVDQIQYDADDDQFRVTLSFLDEIDFPDRQVFDRVVANVGYRPDNRIYEELQVHQCYASDGPMKLAAALAGETSADCLDQPATGPASLVNPEPNFYIVGAKSYGRNSRFLYRLGLEQIRDLFTILGDRETLNLYESARSLL
jgi:hypothetical protein